MRRHTRLLAALEFVSTFLATWNVVAMEVATVAVVVVETKVELSDVVVLALMALVATSSAIKGARIKDRIVRPLSNVVVSMELSMELVKVGAAIVVIRARRALILVLCLVNLCLVAATFRLKPTATPTDQPLTLTSMAQSSDGVGDVSLLFFHCLV
jgi:hypothetical protein